MIEDDKNIIKERLRLNKEYEITSKIEFRIY